jgi:hypothetical protein
MEIKTEWNKLDKDWWFDLGICYERTYYNGDYNRVILIALGIATIYIRFNKK